MIAKVLKKKNRKSFDMCGILYINRGERFEPKYGQNCIGIVQVQVINCYTEIPGPSPWFLNSLFVKKVTSGGNSKISHCRLWAWVQFQLYVLFLQHLSLISVFQ